MKKTEYTVENAFESEFGHGLHIHYFDKLKTAREFTKTLDNGENTSYVLKRFVTTEVVLESKKFKRSGK